MSERSPYAAAQRARDTRDVDALIDLLSRGDQRARVVAARHLGELGARRSVGALISNLRASDFIVRIAALNALAAIGDGSAADAIALLGMTDESIPVRASAYTALALLNDRRADQVLLEIAALDGKDTARARRWATRKLANAGVVDAIPILESQVGKARLLERRRIRRSLRKLQAKVEE